MVYCSSLHFHFQGRDQVGHAAQPEQNVFFSSIVSRRMKSLDKCALQFERNKLLAWDASPPSCGSTCHEHLISLELTSPQPILSSEACNQFVFSYPTFSDKITKLHHGSLLFMQIVSSPAQIELIVDVLSHWMISFASGAMYYVHLVVSRAIRNGERIRSTPLLFSVLTTM